MVFIGEVRASGLFLHLTKCPNIDIVLAIAQYLLSLTLCGSVGKEFVYHACGHEFESRLKVKVFFSSHHL